MRKLAVAICGTALMLGCSEKVTTPAAPVAVVAHAPQPQVSAPTPAPAPAPAPTPAPANLLSAEAIGKVRFGDTLEQVEAALQEKASGPRSNDCVYVTFASLPNVQLMVENKIVMRADIKAGVPNTTGFNIGDDPGQLRSKYPAATVGPHKYVQGGHEIRIPGSGKSMLIFEDDGSKITGVRGGIDPAVSYVEGCS